MAKLSGGWLPLTRWPPAALLGTSNGESKILLGTEPVCSKWVNACGFASLFPEQFTALWQSASFKRAPWGMSQAGDAQVCHDRTARDPNSTASKATTLSTNPSSPMGGRHWSSQNNLKVWDSLWRVAFKNKNLQNFNTVLFLHCNNVFYSHCFFWDSRRNSFSSWSQCLRLHKQNQNLDNVLILKWEF